MGGTFFANFLLSRLLKKSYPGPIERQKPWVALEFSLCVFCHLLEKDHQAWKADRQCGRGCALLVPPSLSQGWAEYTAKLVKCHDVLGFLLDHLNSQPELSQGFPYQSAELRSKLLWEPASQYPLASFFWLYSMLIGIALKYFSLV